MHPKRARQGFHKQRATHADATGLAKAGVVERTPAGKYLFPFDRVKVRYTALIGSGEWPDEALGEEL